MADAAPPPAPPAPARPPERATAGSTGLGDWVFSAVCRSAGVLILATVAALVLVLVVQSRPALSRAGELRFFTSSAWVPNPPEGEPVVFGSLAFIFGTLATTAIAMALAVPFGVASAAYLSEIAGAWVRRTGSFLIELLAAIPSVVYGFWGIYFLAPGVQWVFDRVGGPNTGGSGILAAGLILAVMIVPYVTAISFDVIRAVPRSQREGALALGATRWQMIWTAVLPFARPGIIAACFLALGRALGETMAVTMLIGNKAYLPDSLQEWLRVPFALGNSIASVI